MKDETDPITEDEFLLRRVHIQKFRTKKTPYISPSAFEPRIKRDPDVNGISLYREACQSESSDILVSITKEKRSSTGIVRIGVTAFYKLGLSVQPARDKRFRIKGHVVIPELNSDDFAKYKSKWKPTLMSLAAEASKPENIVLNPADADGTRT